MSLAALLALSGATPRVESFNPTDLADCVVWLDATDASTLTLSGSTVTAWLDKSVNGYSIPKVATGGPQTGTRTINGLNALDFDGSTQGFKSSENIGINNETNHDQTVFAVCVVDTVTADQQAVVSTYAGGISNISNLYFLNGISYFAQFGSNNAIYPDAGPVVTTGVPYILRGSFIDNYMDTELNAIGNGPTAMGRSSWYKAVPLGIGVRPSGPPVDFFDGVIGEVIQYARALSHEEIAQVEAYLSAKWGISTSYNVNLTDAPPGISLQTEASYTFDNVYIGHEASDRLVVVCSYVRTGSTSLAVTINGITATTAAILRNNSDFVYVGYASVPTDTRVTIDVDPSGLSYRCLIQAYALYGLTISGVGQSSSSGGISLTIPPGGCAIAASGLYNATVQSCVWVGDVTERCESMVSTGFLSSAVSDVAGNISAVPAWSPSGLAYCAGQVFAPI